MSTLIPDWSAADAALGIIRALDNAAAAIVADRDEELRVIQEEYAPQLDRIADSRAAIVADLEAYCAAHRADFAKARSRKLDNGRVGWRKSKPKPALYKVKSWAGVLAKVLGAGKQLARRVAHWTRQEPVLVREKILADLQAGVITPAEARGLGVRLDKGGDQFFAAPAVDQPRDRNGEVPAVAHPNPRPHNPEG